MVAMLANIPRSGLPLAVVRSRGRGIAWSIFPIYDETMEVGGVITGSADGFLNSTIRGYVTIWRIQLGGVQL